MAPLTRRFAPPRHPHALHTHVGLRLPEGHLEAADALADTLGVTRSEILRTGVALALEAGPGLAAHIGAEVRAWHATRAVGR